jgi:histidinol-phosphate aminotransferase
LQITHGGLNLAELRTLGLSPESVLDFSASINPLGPPPAALDAISRVNLAAYPDSSCLELREALAERLGIGTERILAGNGSTELIHLIARAYLSTKDSAFIFSPTFGEYAAACYIQGVEPGYMLTSEADGFYWGLSENIKIIRAEHPKLVFLCNPNNPTGVYLNKETIQEISSAIGNSGLLVLDEAYVSFVEDAWDSRPLLEMGNIVLLCSMTKDYALPGLRLGYMLARPDVIERVKMFQYSWSVNAAAQAAGIASLEHQEHLDKGREAVRAGKAYLIKELGGLGLVCAPSAANFLLVRVGNAASLRLKLLTRHRVCVRDCASFGLPQYIRIGIRRLEDCHRLAAAISKLTAENTENTEGK